MSNPQFPIYLEQVHVHEYKGFCFTLPERYIGRNDVIIYVEYRASENNSEVMYNVWAQLTEQSIRALIMTSAVAVNPKENIIDTIMEELNGSEEFRETTEHFIEHFDR